MSWYRELAGDEIYRCSECGTRRYVEYVPTGEFCRSCATKKAAKKRSESNVNIDLADNLVVTTEVWSRFTKKAEREIPTSIMEAIGNFIDRFQFLFSILTVYPIAVVANQLSSPDYSFLIAMFASLAWIGGVGFFLGYLGNKIATPPRKERTEKISIRVAELAEERKKAIEEAKQFYSSPEWSIMREQVIREEGRVCAECGNKIRNKNDVTVDHKRPRSKYPDLTLSRDNLRVLCRSCNASKGASEWLEI